VSVLTLLLSLPFMLALALGLHAAVARVAKTVVAASRPLATGETEAYGYERRVYHTAQPEMLQLLGLVFAAGLLLWGGLGWNRTWLWLLGVVLVALAVALDLLRWQRVAGSANYLWSQNGLRSEVRQVAIENIGELSVQEEEVGGFTLRHAGSNRLCRLQVRLNDGQELDLPWTDAYTGLEDVEALANHLRARQMIRGDRQSLQRAGEHATEAARRAAQQAPSRDAEMLAELKRLRRGALAPDVPKAATRKTDT
jgi:hypothetical protein